MSEKNELFDLDQHTIDEMLAIARQMLKRAYAPYSKFCVGACVRAEDGTLFAGCNVENASFGITVCAEVTAVCSMIAAGKKQITAVAIAAPREDLLCTPCGRCRQFIREFAPLTTPIFLGDPTKLSKIITLDELLPLSFGPEHLTKI